VMVGLVGGKLIGIFGSSWLATAPASAGCR
jgi:hypothetical protein